MGHGGPWGPLGAPEGLLGPLGFRGGPLEPLHLPLEARGYTGPPVK